MAPITQEVADEITMAAQYYAASLVGHPYRSAQFGVVPGVSKSTIDYKRVWRARNVLPDNCIFCEAMTEESVEQRVLGFQAQIDKEVVRSKWIHYIDWIARDKDVPEHNRASSAKNHRAFVELRQGVKTKKRPQGWNQRPFPLIDLSREHKTKLCITWNHIYIAWMEKDELRYDFDRKEFFSLKANPAFSLPDSSD